MRIPRCKGRNQRWWEEGVKGSTLWSPTIAGDTPMGINGLTFWSFWNVGWEASPYLAKQLVNAVKGLSRYKRPPDYIRDPIKSPGPGPHVSPLHHPRNEFRRELGNPTTTFPSHTPAQPRTLASWYTITRFRWEWGGLGERRGMRTAEVAAAGKVRVVFPPTREPLHPPPRPSYSHFVWQPRVRRQCDLKRNFRPEEERGRD